MIASALIPVLGLILLGYGLSRFAFLPETAWRGIERLAYFVLFPMLLVNTLARQNLVGTPWPAILLVVVGTILAAALALILWHGLRHKPFGPTFTSVFQGGVRFNTYIAIAVAEAFFGPAGLALAAVVAGFMIVPINLLCVSALSLWGERGVSGPSGFLYAVAGNPLLVACAIGWALSVSGLGLNAVVSGALDVGGRAALPLGLLAVGAALRPQAMRGHLGHILAATVVQYGLKPATAAVLVGLAGLTGIPAGALYIAFMCPTAPSAYILAGQLGGDTETMASIITAQTLLAVVLMPLLAAVLLAGL